MAMDGQWYKLKTCRVVGSVGMYKEQGLKLSTEWAQCFKFCWQRRKDEAVHVKGNIWSQEEWPTPFIHHNASKMKGKKIHTWRSLPRAYLICVQASLLENVIYFHTISLFCWICELWTLLTWENLFILVIRVQISQNTFQTMWRWICPIHYWKDFKILVIIDELTT